MQYVAVWCSVVQRGAVYLFVVPCPLKTTSTNHEYAVCHSVWRCVAVWCRVLQSVAVCCSVMQRSAVWCKWLQCVFGSMSHEDDFHESLVYCVAV